MLPSWQHTAFLILAFMIVVIAAAHSVGPIGLILALAWSREWLLQVIAGWVAIAVLLIGRAYGRRAPIGVLRAGAILSAVAWLLFVVKSEAILGTLVSSLPYAAALATWIERTWGLVRTDAENDARAKAG